MRHVERAFKLHHRGDRHVRTPVAERNAQRANRPLEHPRWDQKVGARIGVDFRDGRQALECRRDVGAMFTEQHALPVRGVGANAHVAHNTELGHGLLDRSDRAGHDVVGLARENGVLVLPVAHAEKEKPRESSRGRAPCFPHHFGKR